MSFVREGGVAAIAVDPLKGKDEGAAAERVDETIQSAGEERQAVAALLLHLAEAERNVSLGYRRGAQPPRPAG